MKNKVINLTSKNDLDKVMTTLDTDSIMSDGYGIICKTVMTDKNLSIQAKAIYAYLASFAGSEGSCYPTVKRIREDLKIKSSDTYYKYLQQLIEFGYIVVYQTRIDNMKSNNVYELIMSKNRINKIKSENKKVASTGNTNNSDESQNDSKSQNDINIISQSEENIQDKNKNNHKNIELLKKSSIKYIPYNKENETILSLDTNKLEQAIKITKEKADNPNWNYLYSTYLNLENNLNSSNDKRFNSKTRFHNINQTFNKYDSEELERMLLERQKEKFK